MYKTRQVQKGEKKTKNFPCNNDRNPDDQSDAHPLDPQRVFMFQAGPGHQLATLGSSNEDPQNAASARPGSERSE